MCLVQGGAAVRLFSSSVYEFLCGMKPSNITVDISEVSEIREFIETVHCWYTLMSSFCVSIDIIYCIPFYQITKCQSDVELQSLLVSNCDLVIDRGYTKPLFNVTLSDKNHIVQTHEVLLKSLGEAQQFQEGLTALNVAEVLSKHGDCVRGFFCNDPSMKEPLTADISSKIIIMK